MDEIKAWHFVGQSLRDGRPIPADGEWLVHDGALEICTTGLHASVRAIDALQHAPGATICRVSCKGIGEHRDDKFVCRERRIDWRLENADALLRAFARHAALSVIHLWNAPQVVRDFLETGNPELRAAAADAAWGAARAAAGDAAWAAAADAAWGAVRAAVRAAAWAAAGAAAWGAVRGAAGDAAWAATWDAARAATWDEMNRELERAIESAHGF